MATRQRCIKRILQNAKTRKMNYIAKVSEDTYAISDAYTLVALRKEDIDGLEDEIDLNDPLKVASLFSIWKDGIHGTVFSFNEEDKKAIKKYGKLSQDFEDMTLISINVDNQRVNLDPRYLKTFIDLFDDNLFVINDNLMIRHINADKMICDGLLAANDNKKLKRYYIYR